MEMHPSQFKVNEAWILFQLTAKPIITERDGPAHCFALMDAASCFILSSIFTAGDGAVSKECVLDLFTQGWAHKKKYPGKLFVPSEILNDELETAAFGQGVPVTGVPERQLLAFIKEAQEEFRKEFG